MLKFLANNENFLKYKELITSSLILSYSNIYYLFTHSGMQYDISIIIINTLKKCMLIESSGISTDISITEIFLSVTMTLVGSSSVLSCMHVLPVYLAHKYNAYFLFIYITSTASFKLIQSKYIFTKKISKSIFPEKSTILLISTSLKYFLLLKCEKVLKIYIHLFF